MPDNTTDICLEQCFHPETVRSVRHSMTPERELELLSGLFKVLGDRTRMMILSALHQSELCVCDLTSILSMNQSAVSHQLRVLRAAKIVKSRKDGKNVYYSLDDEHISMLMDTGLEHVRENG
ncbi:MAG: winged helix-turn-helix transcriptional regulator [Prosthecochloris sp.]|nr:winged helix-turn-helix transcriptional regulator [Prosthecochloris sp.]